MESQLMGVLYQLVMGFGKLRPGKTGQMGVPIFSGGRTGRRVPRVCRSKPVSHALPQYPLMRHGFPLETRGTPPPGGGEPVSPPGSPPKKRARPLRGARNA